MRILSLQIENFRTIESMQLSLHPTYTAICGPNDSGKTNVIRAIRALLKEEDDTPPFFDSAEISYKDDFPKWKTQESAGQNVAVSAQLVIERGRDAGLFQSIVKQLEIAEPGLELNVTVKTSHAPEATTKDCIVKVGEKEYKGLDAQEVINRIQSANCVIFHNSTQAQPRMFFRGGMALGQLKEISRENELQLEKMEKTVNSGLTKVARGQQKEIEELLGKLELKYKVGLSLPTLEFSHVPFGITLGETKFKVGLKEWGSGTRNRTQILLALFTAKRIAESEESARKTTPVMIIEEPECFLHPSAQAEFARVIRDLADEFSVQVIMTTHSPFMLSMKSPESNVLLTRKRIREQVRQTERVDTTGENWMRPFSEVLGLDSDEFKPWRGMFSGSADSILLVEGDTDKEYFEMLRATSHGEARLRFDGEILSYGGVSTLTNVLMLQFLRNRYQKVFITFDLDSKEEVEAKLKQAGFQPDVDYLPIGVAEPGRKCVEGLLPDSIKSTVRERNPNIVDAFTSAVNSERKSASNRLKTLYLEEIKNEIAHNASLLTNFYPFVQKINNGFEKRKKD
jgi:putative ATP-dependent endonuclease of OLD family